MLRTRIITALALLVLLLGVMWSGRYWLVASVTCVFFAAAAWEGLRLFGAKRPKIGAVLWTAVFAYIAFRGTPFNAPLLFLLCGAVWLFRMVPALVRGLPENGSMANRFLMISYGICIFGFFLALLTAYRHSALYLLSAMAVIWIADIGAYFSGKAFGKHKLAPSISPGKSWEGAIGGGLCVLAASGFAVSQPSMIDTFPTHLLLRTGWFGAAAVLVIIVAASISGDLFESQLKRRVGVKDSSTLLPGHGGVLDRIDALIPAMPLMLLSLYWF
ncbi:MAG: hypothetical protein K0S28_773 [Paucimonas sp.]|jgi:phosphatidate cytidylyltransferase|nr:hypothetical protein [Paucimonas sp.]